MFLYIVLFLVLVLIFYVINNRSLFWGNQPVMRHSSVFSRLEDGKIKNDLEDYNTDPIDPEDEFWGDLEPESFYNFIRNNYIDNDRDYSMEHIRDVLARSSFGIGLYSRKRGNSLIGSITGENRLYVLRDKKTIKGLHVDFLCVDKSLRKEGYGPLLINAVLQFHKDNGYDMCSFFKDTKPLPIKHVSFNKYYSNIFKYSDRGESSPMKMVDGSNSQEAKRFFEDFLKNNTDFRPKYDTKYFEIRDSYLVPDESGKSVGLMVLEKENVENVFIRYLFAKKDHEKFVYENIRKTLLGKRWYIIDTKNHRRFIEWSNGQHSGNCYFYFYNYSVADLEKNRICF